MAIWSQLIQMKNSKLQQSDLAAPGIEIELKDWFWSLNEGPW